MFSRQVSVSREPLIAEPLPGGIQRGEHDVLSRGLKPGILLGPADGTPPAGRSTIREHIGDKCLKLLLEELGVTAKERMAELVHAATVPQHPGLHPSLEGGGVDLPDFPVGDRQPMDDPLHRIARELLGLEVPREHQQAPQRSFVVGDLAEHDIFVEHSIEVAPLEQDLEHRLEAQRIALEQLADQIVGAGGQPVRLPLEMRSVRIAGLPDSEVLEQVGPVLAGLLEEIAEHREVERLAEPAGTGQEDGPDARPVEELADQGDLSTYSSRCSRSVRKSSMPRARGAGTCMASSAGRVRTRRQTGKQRRAPRGDRIWRDEPRASQRID